MTQEARQVDILRPAVKDLIRIEHTRRVLELVRRAFAIATRGIDNRTLKVEKGDRPVWLVGKRCFNKAGQSRYRNFSQPTACGRLNPKKDAKCEGAKGPAIKPLLYPLLDFNSLFGFDVNDG